MGRLEHRNLHSYQLVFRIQKLDYQPHMVDSLVLIFSKIFFLIFHHLLHPKKIEIILQTHIPLKYMTKKRNTTHTLLGTGNVSFLHFAYFFKFSVALAPPLATV